MTIEIHPPRNAVQYASPDAEKIKQISTGPVTLLSVLAYNNGSATAYLQIFDATTAPTTTVTAPSLPPIPVPAGSSAAFDIPYKASAGIYIALSSTPLVYTVLGSDDAIFFTRHL